MENIESRIKSILSSELEVPLSYKRMVKRTLYEQENRKIYKRFSIKKLVLATSACFLLTTSIVFAKEITSFIKNFFYNNIGMDVAIDNGYISTESTKCIESNGTKIKINKFLMDNYNLNLDFSIELNSQMEENSILSMVFPDIIITDENNNILFCQNKNVFDKYCNEHGLNYKWDEFNDNHINSGSNFYIKSSEKNSINFIYNIYASNFPASKKLIINLNDIIISKKEDTEQDSKEITGSWNFKIDVPEQFYNRKEITYKVIYSSNDKFKVTNATVSNTCMKLEYEIESETQLPYNLDDDEETKNRKIDEYIEKQKNETYEEFKNKRKFKDEYVENQYGKKFYPSRSTDQDSGYSNIEMKYLIHWQTFNLTKYDTTDLLNVYFNYKGENVLIKLEKE